MNPEVGMHRAAASFAAGAAVGTMGGLIGLGGAEFRLPLLVVLLGYATRDAIGLNVLLSLVTVSFSLGFRLLAAGLAPLNDHADALLALTIGSIAGAWMGVAIGRRLATRALIRVAAVLLMVLAVVMVLHAFDGSFDITAAQPQPWRAPVATLAGILIGIVASLLGVAGGELLIPALILIYALDAKTAGTIALAISLPTLLISLARWRHARGDWRLWRSNATLLIWMGAGSIAGAAIGTRLLGLVDARLLGLLLAALLAYSALHLARHAR
jgi:uncharacterized membrane protein YfcA